LKDQLKDQLNEKLFATKIDDQKEHYDVKDTLRQRISQEKEYKSALDKREL